MYTKEYTYILTTLLWNPNHPLLVASLYTLHAGSANCNANEMEIQ